MSDEVRVGAFTRNQFANVYAHAATPPCDCDSPMHHHADCASLGEQNYQGLTPAAVERVLQTAVRLGYVAVKKENEK